MTLPKLKSYILGNLPDYSAHIDSKKKLDDFRSLENDADINRVILFSKKAKTPPIFKVLSSVFRERFRFGFVNADTAPAELSTLYEVTEYPAFLVLKSYDANDNKTLDIVEVIRYGKKEYKLDELKEFLQPFARSTKKPHHKKEEAHGDNAKSDEESAQTSAKGRKKPYAELYTDRHFNTHIADNEKAALVYFILGSNINQEVPLFERLTKMTLGPL